MFRFGDPPEAAPRGGTKRPAMTVLDRLLAPESPLQARFHFLAKRFVAGETVSEALAAVRELNGAGAKASLDLLGEDLADPADAERTVRAYEDLADALATAGVASNVSLKLSALGLGIDEDLARENLLRIVRHARAAAERAGTDPFVRIDMEGSATVDATWRVFEAVYAHHDNVGIVLQAYLKRTPADVERAIALGARVRLCKGAYNEPPAVAHKDMDRIRRAYVQCAEALLERGHYPAIATHDERLVKAIRAYARERGIGRERFEFQLLYGVRPDLQRTLVAAGHNVRVYVPFGAHWAAYFARRITERPENALFALRALVDSGRGRTRLR